MIKIDMGDLRGAVGFAAKKGSILDCVHLEVGDNGYRVIANDSFKLGVFQNGDVGEVLWSCNISVDEIKMIPTKIKFIAISGEELRWVPCNVRGWLEEDLETSNRYIRTVEGEYPDYRKVLGKEQIEFSEFILDNSLLAEFCSAVKKAYGKGVRLHFTLGENDSRTAFLNPSFIYVSAEVRDRKFNGLIMPCSKRR